MNVLFLTLGWITDINARGIYTDLLREFIHHGHRCYIVTPKERSTGEPTSVTDFPGGKILGVKTLNIQKTNIVEKGTVFVCNTEIFCECLFRFDSLLYAANYF